MSKPIITVADMLDTLRDGEQLRDCTTCKAVKCNRPWKGIKGHGGLYQCEALKKLGVV